MPGNGLVQSLARGLTILDVVALHGEASLQDIVAATGLKKPTAHNLVRTLIASGYLYQTCPGAGYMLGDAPTRLALSHQQQRLHTAGAAAMHDLREALPSATFTLGRYIDGNITAVLRNTTTAPHHVEHPLGMIMHPYSSATALLFQAMWDETERDTFRLLHPFSEMGGPLWQSEEALDHFLAASRSRGGVVLDKGQSQGRNLVPLAVPIEDTPGHTTAALGIALSGNETIAARKVNRALEAAQAAAARIIEILTPKGGTQTER